MPFDDPSFIKVFYFCKVGMSHSPRLVRDDGLTFATNQMRFECGPATGTCDGILLDVANLALAPALADGTPPPAPSASPADRAGGVLVVHNVPSRLSSTRVRQ